MTWFAVRSFYRSGRSVSSQPSTYEERIVVFDATSADDAIARAEHEAAEYVLEGVEVLPCFQSYELFDNPGDGAEVFSLMRDSALEPDDYLDRFFDTGVERQRPLG